MKIGFSISFVLSFTFLHAKAEALTCLCQNNIQDTLYIFMKPDNQGFNEVSQGIGGTSYSIYGFLHDNRPRDWLDSAGYLGMYISTEKDTLQICSEPECKQNILAKAITLYDLSWTLAF